jgi:hypothetical protein
MFWSFNVLAKNWCTLVKTTLYFPLYEFF